LRMPGCSLLNKKYMKDSWLGLIRDSRVKLNLNNFNFRGSRPEWTDAAWGDGRMHF
jgi:hypothetical protein